MPWVRRNRNNEVDVTASARRFQFVIPPSSSFPSYSTKGRTVRVPVDVVSGWNLAPLCASGVTPKFEKGERQVVLVAPSHSMIDNHAPKLKASSSLRPALDWWLDDSLIISSDRHLFSKQSALTVIRIASSIPSLHKAVT